VLIASKLAKKENPPGTNPGRVPCPKKAVTKEAELLSQGWAGTYSSDPFARTVLEFRFRPFRALSFAMLVPCAAAKSARSVFSSMAIVWIRGPLEAGAGAGEGAGVSEATGVFAAVSAAACFGASLVFAAVSLLFSAAGFGAGAGDFGLSAAGLLAATFGVLAAGLDEEDFAIGAGVSAGFSMLMT